MTDRPIIFSAPMIRAMLDGRKSQTRRIVKLPTKTHSGGPIYERPDMGGWASTTIGGHGAFTEARNGDRVPAPERPAIWHQTTGCVVAMTYIAGDRLWVREGHALGRGGGAIYRAEHPDASFSAPLLAIGTWRPSIHMPRWASRLTLTVTDVRVERLQSISEADAIAEGATMRLECSGFRNQYPGWSMDWTRADQGKLPHSDIFLHDPQMAFANLWDSLHGPEAWGENPWCVAVSFTVQRGNIDQIGEIHD